MTATGRYQKAFNPARASGPSRALYEVLSDGTSHPVDSVVDVMAESIPVMVAVRWGGGPSETADPHKVVESKQRAMALNALMVARRLGRVTQDGHNLTLDPAIAEAWLNYTRGAQQS